MNQKTINILDLIQRSIAFVIGALFLIGLIPFYFDDVYGSLILLLAIQFVISISRLNIINIILEVILIVFAFFSLIPILGYIFRFLGFVLSLIDYGFLNSNSMVKFYKFDFRNHPGEKTPNNKVKGKKKKPEFKDAEFKEK